MATLDFEMFCDIIMLISALMFVRLIYGELSRVTKRKQIFKNRKNTLSKWVFFLWIIWTNCQIFAL